MKDNWDRCEIVIAKIGVPIFLGFVALVINKSISDRTYSAQMTEIALEIFATELEENKATALMRGWAGEVLKSPKKFHAVPEDVVEAMLSQTSIGSSRGGSEAFGEGTIDKKP